MARSVGLVFGHASRDSPGHKDSSPELAVLFDFFAFLGFSLFSTHQAKPILFAGVRFFPVQPRIYSSIISACAKEGHWQQALKLFWAMPEATVQHNVFAFSAAARLFRISGRCELLPGIQGVRSPKVGDFS